MPLSSLYILPHQRSTTYILSYSIIYQAKHCLTNYTVISSILRVSTILYSIPFHFATGRDRKRKKETQNDSPCQHHHHHYVILSRYTVVSVLHPFHNKPNMKLQSLPLLIQHRKPIVYQPASSPILFYSTRRCAIRYYSSRFYSILFSFNSIICYELS